MTAALPDSAIVEWLRDGDPEPVVDLAAFFPPAFMRTHTRFDSFSAFAAASPRDFDDRSDIEPLHDAALDGFVSSDTQFTSWREMVNAAAERELRDHLLV